MNKIGGSKFVGYSAGSHPRGEVHPHALKLLNNLGHDTSGLRSKAWDEFAQPGAPQLDFIITVCDNAAGEVCPVWPGKPVTAHWGLPDPGHGGGSEAEIALAFADTYRMVTNRIAAFVSLPFDQLSRQSIQRRMDEIGEPPNGGA